MAVLGVPDWVFGPDGIIKKMKTNGEWEFDQLMVEVLGIEVDEFVNKWGKSGKAMTAAVIAYLQLEYPEKAD